MQMLHLGIPTEETGIEREIKQPISTGAGWARQRQRLQEKARRDFEQFLEEQRKDA